MVQAAGKLQLGQSTVWIHGKLLGVPNDVVKRFNFIVADMFGEIVYEATGKRLEDYVIERKN